MTGFRPSLFLRLKWHFRENRTLYLGLIVSGAGLLLLDPARPPSGRRRWLWDLNPDLYSLVTSVLFYLVVALCFAIIARTAYRAFKGTDPMDAATRKTEVGPAPRFSTSDPKDDVGRRNE
jgi:hypothetical protein